MANPFVDPNATYERTIRDERDGEEWQVTFRHLTAGDRAELQDLARMQIGGDEEDTGSVGVRMGRAQIITLDKAIVSWTLPLSKTRDTLAALQADIFDQMFGYIAWGEEPPAQETWEDPTQQSSSSEQPEPEPAAEPTS